MLFIFEKAIGSLNSYNYNISTISFSLQFMKRTKDRVEQEDDERDREQLYQGQLSGLQSGSYV